MNQQFRPSQPPPIISGGLGGEAPQESGGLGGEAPQESGGSGGAKPPQGPPPISLRG